MHSFLSKVLRTTTILFGIVGLIQDEAAFGENQKKLWGDSRLSVRIDKVERIDVVPEELKSPGYRYHPPKKGNDFVLIYFSTPQIRNTFFIGLGGRNDSKSLLFDSKGSQFKFHSWFLSKGLISFNPPAWGEKASGFLMFQGPKNDLPAKLIFRYYFKDNLKNKSKKMGEIEINLSEIN